MAGLPVIIRLIDPPLHEFLPSLEDLIRETTELKATRQEPDAARSGCEKIMARVEELHEANPMLGLRGVRLSILFPEITRMQVRAIMEAACDLRKQEDRRAARDHDPARRHARRAATRCTRSCGRSSRPVQKEKGVSVPYKFGTMIEIPRAALTAGEIATEAEFFSFGTNDLTQTTFGYSRDDAERHFIVQVPRAEDPAAQPVRDDRRERRGPADGASPSPKAARRGRSWRSGSAASTAATPTRSTSATSWA